MESKESLMILNKTRANILLQKIISLKLQLNIVPRDYNIANSCQKEIKQNMSRKKIILKGNITTTYIEYKHKNTVALIQPPNVSLRASFGLSEI